MGPARQHAGRRSHLPGVSCRGIRPLTRGGDRAVIRHSGQTFALPITRQNKLILTNRAGDRGPRRRASRPKRIVRMLLPRYRGRKTRGTHVDDAVTSAARADLSGTLLLCVRETREGGALGREEQLESRTIGFGARDLILHPSGALHPAPPGTPPLRAASARPRCRDRRKAPSSPPSRGRRRRCRASWRRRAAPRQRWLPWRSRA
jgi:hypothetical protein